MEFVVPLLIAVLVVVIGLVIMRLLSRNKGRGPRPGSGSSARPAVGTTREAAAAASGRLNQQQHIAVYALIAQGQAFAAIREYRTATGAGLREATSAVAQMSAHPQPYTAPRQSAPTLRPEDEGSREASPGHPEDKASPQASPAGPEDEATRQAAAAHPPEDEEPQAAAPAYPANKIVPPAEPAPAPLPEPAGYRYRAIVSKGDTIREVASTRLNDDVFRRIRTAALGGDRDGAVRLLLEHSEATEVEAREFVDLIEPDEEP